MYTSVQSRISSLQFGILSPEEIRDGSVSEITTANCFNEDGTAVRGGLFDARMGPTTKDVRCETDLLPYDLTPGYFGRIELNVPVFHHAFIHQIVKILSVICIECASLLNPPCKSEETICISDVDDYIKNAHISESQLLSLPAKDRLRRLKNIQTKKRRCSHCKCLQPTNYVVNSSSPTKRGNTIDGIYKYNKKVNKSNRADDEDDDDNDDEKNPYPEGRSIFPEYAYRLFKKIDKNTCTLLGFNYQYSHPSSLILHVIPVCPPLCRPSVKQGNGHLSQDHLTIRYGEVIKTNSGIRGYLNKNQGKNREDMREFLTHETAVLFDNDPAGSLPSMPRGSSQPHQTFGQRLRGRVPKDGRIRGNLLSRRVEMSARSVITPDPMIDLDEIGIPKAVAMSITYPDKVTVRNIAFLQACIQRGADEYPGATGFMRKNTTKMIKPNSSTLKVGDVVMRHLCNGDYVLMNRQPTLHKTSMMGHRVRVVEGLSFRLNVNVTEPYNADFDGDEMNLHCPQTTATVSELAELAGLKNQCMSAASNSPAIAFVQDNVLAAHLLSKDKKAFNQRELMNTLARGAPFYYGQTNKKSYSGGEILSFYTPDYTDDIKDKLTKKDLYRIISKCYHEFGNRKCFEMTGMIQKLLTEYLTHRTFSIGPKDLHRSDDVHTKVDRIADEMAHRVSERIEQIHACSVPCDQESFEAFVSKEIDNATEKSEDLLSKNEQSRFKTMIESQSKGKKKNITQMKGFLGQQIVDRKRTNIGYTDRTLPHFKKYSEDVATRGFIRSSLCKGLHPFEFYFHAGGGREGLIEQGLQTGDTGYIQRQMVKTLEDMVVRWSRTVSDAQDNIVQFLYGDDNATGESIEKQDLSCIFKATEELDINYCLTINEEHWKACVDPRILEAVPQNTDLFTNYYNDFLSIRNRIVDDFCTRQKLQQRKIEKSCGHSVNVEQKVDMIRHKFKLSKSAQTDLDPTTIIMAYNTLFDRCDSDKIANSCSLLFKMLIYAHAGPKKLICEHRMTRDAFKEFVRVLETCYKFSRIEPGEPVGVIAAQSIGEPCTQLTLNSFHFAGAGRSQGVPRLQELVYLENGRRNSSSTLVYLRPPHCFLEKDADIIAKEIGCIRIKDTLLSYMVLFDSPEYTDPFMLRYREFEKKLGIDGSNTSSLVLRFVFTKSQSLLSDIWYCLNELSLVNNPVLDEEFDSIFFRVQVDQDFDLSNIDSLIESDIAPCVINGIEGITDAHVEKTVTFRRDSVLGSLHTQEEYIITATGTELQKLFCNPAVDTTLTRSNNVLDTYETLGIEATRVVLIEELSLVLEKVTDLDVRHVSLLIDRMVGTGKPLPISMRGMDGHKNGPLAKASYERITNEFQMAGLCGDVDNITGMSANIIVGQAPPCGTGTVKVSMDERMFETEI